MICNVFSFGNAQRVNSRSDKREDQSINDILPSLEKHTDKCNYYHPPKYLALISTGLPNNKTVLRAIAGQVAGMDLSGRAWKAQPLAMIANALSKADGNRVTRAQKNIADQVISMDLSGQEWTAQHLAMMASGLSKAGGNRVTRALREIAGQVVSMDLSGQEWIAQHLAMMANGLSKADDDQVTRALKRIAGQVARMDLSDWIAQHLAMMANGLRKVDDCRVTSALECIAGQVARMDLSDWLEQDLAILANELSKVDDYRVTRALENIANQVARMDLSSKEWAGPSLTMMASGLSRMRSYSMETYIVRLINNYNMNDRCDDYGLVLLQSLCRLTLSSESTILEGIKLALSFNRCVLGKNRKHQADFYWYVSLLLFALKENTSNEELSAKQNDLINVLRDFDVEECPAFFITDWQVNFVSLFRNKLCGGVTVSSTLDTLREEASISHLQRAVLKKIKKAAISGTTFGTEVLVKGFPVDIVVEVVSRKKYLFVEVDGPQHFLKDKGGELYALAKHRFSEHVLENIIGYKLIRINYQEFKNKTKFKSFIKKARNYLIAED